MYQIIYIDIDEEITAVIDKLRKSKTAEVFLAIPKRSLILQSIVSLKLLSREAEKLEKNIIIATQDPREQKMAEKAGIETRSSLEGLDTEGEMKESIVPKIQEGRSLGKRALVSKAEQRKNMEEIGSDGFYDASVGSVAVKKAPQMREQFRENSSPRRSMSEISRETKRPEVDQRREDREEGNVFSENQEKEKLLRNFFEEQESEMEPRLEKKIKKEVKNHLPVSGRIKKTITVIFVAVLLVAVSVLGYLFLPSAKVQLKTKTKAVEKDLDLRADVKLEKVDFSGLVIPAQIMEKEESFSFSFPVTGKTKSQGQKAKGTVVIYNEFSSTSQSLVATTRLETPDKKIFRLVKGVTVPGTNNVGGKVVPGAIEAEVIADASGEEYNIEATTFSIPGFAGSPKFEKFSAKSTEKMKGGNSAGETGIVSTLTQTDLAMAKGKAETQAAEKIKETFGSSLTEEQFLVESALENTILESTPLSRVGEAVSEFQYRVKIKARTLVFSNSDIKELFKGSLQVQGGASDQSAITLDYGAVNADLGNGTATIKVRGKMSISSEVDMERLKADLAGKSGSEIEELLKNYPQISEIEIDVQPSFLFKKVPQITNRIDISVAN
jgi:hypothetical protein